MGSAFSLVLSQSRIYEIPARVTLKVILLKNSIKLRGKNNEEKLAWAIFLGDDSADK